jgi:hypothetical protein
MEKLRFAFENRHTYRPFHIIFYNLRSERCLRRKRARDGTVYIQSRWEETENAIPFPSMIFR